MQKASEISYYSREQIEEKAEEVLKTWFPEQLEKSKIFPWEKFCRKIKNEYNIRVTIDANLGKGQDGSQIFGAFSLKPREIFVDRSIRYDKRFLFVLAHEIGHLILHRNIDFQSGWNGRFVDTNTTVFNKRGRNDWMEWQANAFAASILMPQATLPLALIRAQNVVSVNCKIPFLVTLSKESISDYENVVSEMARWFCLSRTVIKIRLRELNLVTGSGITGGHISEFV